MRTRLVAANKLFGMEGEDSLDGGTESDTCVNGELLISCNP